MILSICSIQLQDFVLSSEAKAAAADIEERLQLGSKLSDVIHNKEEAIALFDLYRNEGYILTEHKGRFCVSNDKPSHNYYYPAESLTILSPLVIVR